jgi:hypothetical protein
MTDDAIPPSHRGSFRSSSSFSDMSRRLPPFALTQLITLHEFHAQMHMHKDVCCKLEFDYGHNHARATYTLTAPMSEGRDITVSLIELRKGNENFVYSVSCEIDGTLHSKKDIFRASRMHQDIPFTALQWMEERMTSLSRQIFVESPSVPANEIYHGLMRKIGPKNG